MILLSQMAFSPWNIIRYMSKYWQSGGGGGGGGGGEGRGGGGCSASPW